MKNVLCNEIKKKGNDIKNRRKKKVKLLKIVEENVIKNVRKKMWKNETNLYKKKIY